MTVSRVTLAIIVSAALVASFWTVGWFIHESDGDLMHVIATPLCLEVAALAAVYRYHRTGDHVALLLFWLPLAATVAMNVAHGFPSRVLMAVYAIPPVAAVGVGDMFLRDLRDVRRAGSRRKPKTRAKAAASQPSAAKAAAAVSPDADGETAGVVRRYLDGETGRTVDDTQLVRQIEAECGVSRATAYRRRNLARETMAVSSNGKAT